MNTNISQYQKACVKRLRDMASERPRPVLDVNEVYNVLDRERDYMFEGEGSFWDQMRVTWKRLAWFALVTILFAGIVGGLGGFIISAAHTWVHQSTIRQEIEQEYQRKWNTEFPRALKDPEKVCPELCTCAVPASPTPKFTEE